MKKKFILEFDELPALVFVSHDGRHEKIYKDGKEVLGWKSLNIFSSTDDITTHEIEYVTIRERDLK